MPNVQIRHVPDDVHHCLKGQAAQAGQSLNEYLLALRASTPTVTELARRLRERPPYTGPSSAEVIRADRDER